jgi:hypothetical protein
VPAGQDKVRLTLTMPSQAARDPARLGLEGCAVIGGQEVCRAAVPAEDMMQAFAYRHLVPAEAWLCSATGARADGPPWRLVAKEPVKVPAGGTARVRVAAPRSSSLRQVQVALSDPPEGLAVKEVSTDRDGLAVVLSAEDGKAKPGLKGNLIATAFREWTATLADGQPGAKQRAALGVLPAIPFEVVAAPTAAPAPAAEAGAAKAAGP